MPQITRIPRYSLHPICPLWTGCILTQLSPPFQTNSRYSNATAENWMRIIKHNDFIRKVHQSIQGRQKAFEFAFEPISSRILKQHKRTNSSKDDSLVEEVWQRQRTPREVTLNLVQYQA